MDWMNRKQGFGAATPTDWMTIFRHVFKKLEACLGSPIEHEVLCAEDFVGGFSVSIASTPAGPSPIHLSWKGILGAQFHGDDELVYIPASIFPYINRKKVITKDGKDLLELEYIGDTIAEGEWQLEGWIPDVYGEYGYFDADDVR